MYIFDVPKYRDMNKVKSIGEDKMIEKQVEEILSKFYDGDSEQREQILSILACGLGSALDLMGNKYAELEVENKIGYFQVIVNRVENGKKLKSHTEIEKVLEKKDEKIKAKDRMIAIQKEMIYDLTNPPEAICPECQEISCDQDCSNPRASALLGVCNECYNLHCVCEGEGE